MKKTPTVTLSHDASNTHVEMADTIIQFAGGDSILNVVKQYIENALDEGAEMVHVFVNYEKNTLTFIDNGRGFTSKGVNFWYSPMQSPKRHGNKRGRKGTGRFSALSHGDDVLVEVTSQHADDDFSLNLKMSRDILCEVLKGKHDGAEIEKLGGEAGPKMDQTGSTIVIRNLDAAPLQWWTPARLIQGLRKKLAPYEFGKVRINNLEIPPFEASSRLIKGELNTRHLGKVRWELFCHNERLKINPVLCGPGNVICTLQEVYNLYAQRNEEAPTRIFDAMKLTGFVEAPAVNTFRTTGDTLKMDFFRSEGSIELESILFGMILPQLEKLHGELNQFNINIDEEQKRLEALLGAKEDSEEVKKKKRKKGGESKATLRVTRMKNTMVEDSTVVLKVLRTAKDEVELEWELLEPTFGSLEVAEDCRSAVFTSNENCAENGTVRQRLAVREYIEGKEKFPEILISSQLCPNIARKFQDITLGVSTTRKVVVENFPEGGKISKVEVSYSTNDGLAKADHQVELEFNEEAPNQFSVTFLNTCPPGTYYLDVYIVEEGRLPHEIMCAMLVKAPDTKLVKKPPTIELGENKYRIEWVQTPTMPFVRIEEQSRWDQDRDIGSILVNLAHKSYQRRTQDQKDLLTVSEVVHFHLSLRDKIAERESGERLFNSIEEMQEETLALIDKMMATDE